MHNKPCPYPLPGIKILCRDCIHRPDCKDMHRSKLTYCEWYENEEMYRRRMQRDSDLRFSAHTPEYASTMIDVVNQVIFSKKLDKGDPKDSRKSRIQASLGERDGVMKTLTAIMRVTGLDDEDYVGLLIYLNKVKESRNDRN